MNRNAKMLALLAAGLITSIAAAQTDGDTTTDDLLGGSLGIFGVIAAIVALVIYARWGGFKLIFGD